MRLIYPSTIDSHVLFHLARPVNYGGGYVVCGINTLDLVETTIAW